jgi:hypothetical protein
MLFHRGFEGLPEAVTGPMETTPSRHLLTAEHLTELGGPEPFPLDQKQYLAVLVVEHGQGIVDGSILRRCVICVFDRSLP